MQPMSKSRPRGGSLCTLSTGRFMLLICFGTGLMSALFMKGEWSIAVRNGLRMGGSTISVDPLPVTVPDYTDLRVKFQRGKDTMDNHFRFMYGSYYHELFDQPNAMSRQIFSSTSKSYQRLKERFQKKILQSLVNQNASQAEKSRLVIAYGVSAFLILETVYVFFFQRLSLTTNFRLTGTQYSGGTRKLVQRNQSCVHSTSIATVSGKSRYGIGSTKPGHGGRQILSRNFIVR